MFLRLVLQAGRRGYVRYASTHSLVLLEHEGGVVAPASLSALVAATQIGKNVTGIVVGGPEEVKTVLPAAKRLKGLTNLIHASSPTYSPPLPEALTPLLRSVLTKQEGKYTHFFSAHSSAAKSLLPRVAATLDLPAVSDITSLSHDGSSDTTTFTRPIYAGNAIATVCANANIKLKVITVRSTAFTPLSGQAEHEVTVEEVAPIELSDAEKVTEHLKTEVAKSDRPDLGVAKRVVSGGRALKNRETFNATLEPLAEALGAAVGASRAAVDAGYADNSLQVGQTGKIVAPELYIAIGISGAIQHLAGMKDSKMIVAINKDPDAPIFQVADVGIVGDLYDIVPQLVKKLKN